MTKKIIFHKKETKNCGKWICPHCKTKQKLSNNNFMISGLSEYDGAQGIGKCINCKKVSNLSLILEVIA